MKFLRLIVLFLFGSLCAKSQGFIANEGQLYDQYNRPVEDVLFINQVSSNCHLQLRQNGYSYETFETITTATNSIKNKIEIFQNTRQAFLVNRVDIDFLNSNAACRVTAKKALYRQTHYLNTREITTTAYDEVLYEDLYPGIDLQFLRSPSASSSFKYNIIVHPGADAKQIKFKINGTHPELISNALKFKCGQSEFTEKIPLSFYAENNQAAAFFFSLAADTIGFTGTYDAMKTLIIDPVSNLVWSTYHGGAAVDVCMAMGIDGQDNLYTTGYTSSSANIATTGAYQSQASGSLDIFLTKSSSGGQKIWSTYFGSAAVEIAYALHVKQDGTTYIAGATNSTVGLATSAAHQTLYGGGVNDIVIAAFNSAGQRIWASYYGGNGHDIAEAVTCDKSGNVIFSGHTESTGNIASAGAYQTVYNFNYDVCLVKFSATGQRIWGTYYGDSGTDEAYGICTDAQRKIYITGGTTSISDITTAGAHQQSPGGASDAFLARFDSTGTSLEWATYLGGINDDAGRALAVSNGTIFIGGNTSSTNNIASPLAQQSSPYSFDETFIGAFSSTGNRLWCTYFGGEDTEYIFGLIVDSDAKLLICGASSSTMNISTPGAWQASLASIGSYDAFFAAYSFNGIRQFSSYYGGEGNDQARGIARDLLGRIYIAGETTSTTGIATTGAFQPQNNGNGDAFLAKFCVPFKAPIFPVKSATYCPGSITFSSAPGYSNYLWSNGLKINPMTVNIFAPGKYKFWLSVSDGPNCSGTSDTTAITVGACLGLEEEPADDAIICLPSPALDQLLISVRKSGFENSTFTLRDATGKFIRSGTLLGMQVAISLDNLPAGLYIIQLQSPSGQCYRRFIHQ